MILQCGMYVSMYVKHESQHMYLNLLYLSCNWSDGMATCIYMKKKEMKESHIALKSTPNSTQKSVQKREISNVRT